MAAFVRISLAAAAFAISFMGGAIFALRVARVGGAPWELLLYGIPLGVVMGLLLRGGRSPSLRSAMLGFALGCPALLAVISYGRFTFTAITGVIALAILAVILCRGFGRLGKAIPLTWMAAFILPTVVFVSDHAAFSGRIFAFKWSKIERPVFSPYEQGPPEVHGRKAIYVFDLNSADPSAAALLWGWSLYPKFVGLGAKRPEGSLLELTAIQEVIQGASDGPLP